MLGLSTGAQLSKDGGCTWSALRLGTAGNPYYVNKMETREGGLLISTGQGLFGLDWEDIL